MKRKIMLGISLMALLLLAGCGNSITTSDVINCNEGKYAVTKEGKERAELAGYETDSVVVLNNEDTCDVYLKLKKPVLMMGSTVASIPVYSCKFATIDYIHQNMNWTDEYIVDNYCQV